MCKRIVYVPYLVSKGAMVPEMVFWTLAIKLPPSGRACLSLDLSLGLMATIPSAIEEHIQTQI